MPLGAVIFVHDVESITTFYAAILSSEPVRLADDRSWAEFDLSGSRLWIHRAGRGSSGPAARVAQVDPREELPVKLVLPVDDARAVSERVERSGGRVIPRAWGVDYCDPEGNVFGLSPAAMD